MLRLAVAHSLGLLETSSKWDLKTTLIVNFIRSLLGAEPKRSIAVQQAVSIKDPGIQGAMWVSSIEIPKLENDDNVLAAFLKAVDAKKQEGAIYDVPEVEPIYAEWTGYRKDANDKTPHAKELSDAERYNKMMGDASNDITVLYFHGGALYLMDPAVSRVFKYKSARLLILFS
jgi:acetyl esterase/lipase